VRNQNVERSAKNFVRLNFESTPIRSIEVCDFVNVSSQLGKERVCFLVRGGIEVNALDACGYSVQELIDGWKAERHIATVRYLGHSPAKSIMQQPNVTGYSRRSAKAQSG
jgi:hypothetical protein